MTVKEIITAYLKENGYDGLCRDDCGCSLSDLVPCNGECWEDCEPGYKHLQDDGDWIITLEKEADHEG